MTKPDCFAVFRSPQHDAEADCQCCQHERRCMYLWAFNRGLERAAGIVEGGLGRTATSIAAAIRAEMKEKTDERP